MCSIPNKIRPQHASERGINNVAVQKYSCNSDVAQDTHHLNPALDFLAECVCSLTDPNIPFAIVDTANGGYYGAILGDSSGNLYHSQITAALLGNVSLTPPFAPAEPVPPAYATYVSSPTHLCQCVCTPACSGA